MQAITSFRTICAPTMLFTFLKTCIFKWLVKDLPNILSFASQPTEPKMLTVWHTVEEGRQPALEVFGGYSPMT